MTARHSATVAFALIVTLLAVATAYYVPQLPERMAIHFGANDLANGWSSKSGFLSTMVATIALIGCLFAAAGLFRRLPVHLINVPNKDYWLAPDRQNETLDFICNWSRWLLVAVLAFMAVMFVLTIRANLQVPPRLATVFIWLVAGFVIVVLTMIVWLLYRFNKR